jgi:putative transposase
MIRRDNNLLNITWICNIAGISRSGYYSWLKREDIRKIHEEKDKADFEIILEVYNRRGRKKGSRSIHMALLHDKIVMNRKKIQRLMRKFGLWCPIRQANPMRRMAKALKTDTVADNLLKREFREHGPATVLLTDITYLTYMGKKAYLSVIKDAYTKQILSYVLSDSLKVDFVLETVNNLLEDHGVKLNDRTMIHSDQGVHYTSHSFRELLQSKKIRQSMSRRGNCWDNAPQESFFGHMKDEIDLPKCKSFEELKTEIDDYMDYYNNERYQWGLAKLSPNQYAQYLETGTHPLSTIQAA